ncbi:hypothetical protein [Azospirillum himalayense]|uniref:Uncharacterized protein n=1 Tax=Azospirillum himalayense TaxID=654847 RepID=A0ABW0G6Y9_9PROT
MSIDPIDRDKAPPGECQHCDELRAAGITFHPPHRPSSLCRNVHRDGQRPEPHCTCDACF